MLPTVTSPQHYFETLAQRFTATAAKGIHAIFQFELAGEGGGVWHVTVADGAMQVAPTPHESPTATIKMAATDYVDMVNGKLNGVMAFMKGKMKVSGNVIMAQKMQQIFPPNQP